nr:DnaJ domain-containing protein [Methanosarcina sp. KYL-1]
MLDIPRVASPEDIEDRYHLLAKKYHPDISKSSDAHEKFIKVKEAYETLKDPQKRKAYDKSLPPEEKATEASLDPEDPEDSALDSSISPDADLSGSKRAFKSTTIAYVPFKSSPNPEPPVQPASPAREKDVDWSKYVSSGKNPARASVPSDKPDPKSADWSCVKVKYEGVPEESDDSHNKKSGPSIGHVLRKGFLLTFVLTCVLAALAVFSPGALKAIGLEIIVDSFDKVILLAKSLL